MSMSQRGSFDVTLISCTLGSHIPPLGRIENKRLISLFVETGQEGRHDFVRAPEKALIATHLH